MNEGFRVLDAYNGDLELINDKGNFEIVFEKGYPEDFVREWPTIPEDTPLITKEVIKTKKAFLCEDVETLPQKYRVAQSFLRTSGAKSVAILPLKLGSEVIGAVQFTFRTPQKFTPEDKIFMNTLANQCAQAFDRVFALENLQESKEELEVILKNVADGVIAQDSNYRLIYYNNTALKLLACTSASQLRALNKDTSFCEIRDEFNNFISHEALLHKKMTKHQQIAPTTVQVINKRTGSIRWITIKTTGIFHKNGHLFLTINTLQDITKTKELDRRKDDFISVASHELKTPLTSLKLFLDILSHQIEDHQYSETGRSLRKMKDQTQRLQRLITDLTDVSRIQKGKLDLKHEPFFLEELINDTIEGLRLDVTGHEIVFEKKASLPVSADKFRLYQVVSNLLTNASKYSPKGTKIVVTAARKAHNAVISVQDFGIGIAKDQQKKIFEKLYQVNDTSKRTRSGFGMGLYIAAEIIRQHGGEIWVESKKGKGSTFFFTLPLEKIGKKERRDVRSKS